MAAEKNSGNVWHYNVVVPSGFLEVTSTTTTTSAGANVALHNPGEYSGSHVTYCSCPQ